MLLRSHTATRVCSWAAGQLSCTKHRTLLLPTAPSAGFHNASLYPALRPAVPPLVALLRDEEDRTRANAAGALGNLVRNSGMLCRDIREAGALEVRACVRAQATVGGGGAVGAVGRHRYSCCWRCWQRWWQ